MLKNDPAYSMINHKSKKSTLRFNLEQFHQMGVP